MVVIGRVRPSLHHPVGASAQLALFAFDQDYTVWVQLGDLLVAFLGLVVAALSGVCQSRSQDA